MRTSEPEWYSQETGHTSAAHCKNGPCKCPYLDYRHESHDPSVARLVTPTAGARTEAVLRDLAARPEDWDRQEATGEPDYSAFTAERRAAADLRDLSGATQDPDLAPPQMTPPPPPTESDEQLLARIARERGGEAALPPALPSSKRLRP
eukprot:gene6235-3585_t